MAGDGRVVQWILGEVREREWWMRRIKEESGKKEKGDGMKIRAEERKEGGRRRGNRVSDRASKEERENKKGIGKRKGEREREKEWKGKKRGRRNRCTISNGTPSN